MTEKRTLATQNSESVNQLDQLVEALVVPIYLYDRRDDVLEEGRIGDDTVDPVDALKLRRRVLDELVRQVSDR